MAQTFLIFDFGTNEEAAQQARHRIEGWKQGFRLDKKLQLKFERTARTEAAEEPKAQPVAKKGKGKATPKADKPQGKEKTDAFEDVRLIVRLDFSDHEKLSNQRWMERIPSDDLFKTVKAKIIHSSDGEFAATEDLFDTLD